MKRNTVIYNQHQSCLLGQRHNASLRIHNLTHPPETEPQHTCHTRRATTWSGTSRFKRGLFYRASLACRDRELVVDKSIPAHTALYWAAARFKLRLRLGQEVGRQVAPCPSSKPAGMRACGFMPVPRRRIDFVYSTALCSTSMGIKPATVHYRKTK
jgi:hypothetical protein